MSVRAIINEQKEPLYPRKRVQGLYFISADNHKADTCGPPAKSILGYRAARAGWEKTYGDKTANSVSIRDRLRQKKQTVKEREADKVYQARQKDKGAR